MYRELHDALSRAAEAVRMRDRFRAHRKELDERLGVAKVECIVLRDKLAAERKDVERLEGVSLQRLLAAIAGKLGPMLDEERQEAELAEARFVEQDRLVVALTCEIEELDRRIAELGDVDALHHEALEAKGRMLVERDDEHGRLVQTLADAYSQACAVGRELREAIECGTALAVRLGAAASALDEALDTGAWDIWGGGAWVTANKNEELDRASGHMMACDVLLARFRRELADVGRELAPHGPYEILAAGASSSPLARVADYMFGGVTDMLIQRRIGQTARQLAVVRHEVQRCLDELAHATTNELERRKQLRARLEAAITAG